MSCIFPVQSFFSVTVFTFAQLFCIPVKDSLLRYARFLSPEEFDFFRILFMNISVFEKGSQEPLGAPRGTTVYILSKHCKNKLQRC